MPSSRTRRVTSCAAAASTRSASSTCWRGRGRVTPRPARTALTEALALWRGDAYAEFAHEEWARAEVVRLTELRISAVEELAELLVAMKEHSAAIAMLEPVIDLHRFRDGLRGQLMRALAQSGRQTEALRQFQAYRTLLAEEVGTEPSPELAALDQAIAAGADRPPTPRDGRTAVGPRAASDRPAGRSLGCSSSPTSSDRRGCGHSTPMRWPRTWPSTTSCMSTAIHERGARRSPWPATRSPRCSSRSTMRSPRRWRRRPRWRRRVGRSTTGSACAWRSMSATPSTGEAAGTAHRSTRPPG